MIKFYSFISITALLFLGCGEGLNPDTVVDPGFGGTITFVSHPPPQDSIKDIRVVAVPYFPVDTTFSDILFKVTQGIISYSPSQIAIADSGKTMQYQLFVKPQTYFYIAIVQQFGADIYTQWRVVSIYGYSPHHPSPKSVKIENNTFINDVNFIVDFNHLPPQPFKVP